MPTRLNPLLKVGLAGLALLASAATADAAPACPASGKGWRDFSSVTVSAPEGGVMSLTLLTDGVHATLDHKDKHQELLQLNEGTHLHRGHDPSKGPSPFMFMDMSVGVFLKPLALQYATPCDVPAEPATFTRTGNAPGDPSEVKGTVRWLPDATLSFELQLTLKGHPSGRPLPMNGTIRFDQRRPAPADMPLSGWIATRGGAVGPAEALPSSAATLRELREQLAQPR